MTTVVYDNEDFPRVTLSKSATGVFDATIEVDGLDPRRSTTSEERSAGISSLAPPTVRVRPKRTAYATHQALIALAQRALSASATSTMNGDTGGPGGLLMTHFRTAVAMRSALRLLGEEI